MRMFTFGLELVKLPFVAAKDLLFVIPDLAVGDAFYDTRRQCEELDDLMRGK